MDPTARPQPAESHPVTASSSLSAPARVRSGDPKLRTAQVTLLYESLPASLVATVVCVVALVVVDWEIVPHGLLLAWLASMLAISAGRWNLARLFHRSVPVAGTITYWERAFLVGTALAGLVWGSTAWALFPDASLPHQLFLVFVLGGISAGAASTLIARFSAFLCFVVPTLLPITARLLVHGGPQSKAMALYAAIFAVLIVFTALRMSRAAACSLELQFENASLVDQLAAQVKQDRQMELMLEVDREHHRFLIEQASDIIYRTDSNGRVTFINPAVTPLLGYSETEVLGHRFSEFVHEDYRPQAEQLHGLQVLHRRRSTYYELPLIAKGGREVWIGQNVQLLQHDGSVVGFQAVVRDISTIKRAEAALQEQAHLATFSAAVNAVLTRNEPLPSLLQTCLDIAVRELDLALARIWVLGPGDRCGDCHKAASCADRTQCLHLAASVGLSKNLDGEYRRVPLGVLKIGRIAQGLGSMITNDVLGDERLPNKQWIMDNGLRAFAGFPLIVDGTVFGVFAVFGRTMLSEATQQALEAESHVLAAAISRKQAENKLQRTQFTMDQAVDAVYWVDSQARILYANEAASAMLGYSREELGAMAVHDLNPDFQAARWPGFWAETRRRKTMVFETFHRAKDGRLIPIEIQVSYLAHEGHEFHCAFVRDITERKRAQEAVERHRQRLALQVAEMPLGHIEWDLGLHVTAWNRAAERIFGFAAEDTIGRHASFIIPEDIRPLVDDVWSRLIAGDRTAHSINDNLTRDGRRITCQWTNTPLRGEDGQVIGAFSMVADITENRRFQESLERRVVERTGELQQANQALRGTTAHLQTIIEESPLAIIELDEAGRVISWNSGSARIFGWTESEVLGRELPYVRQHQREESDQIWTSIMSGAPLRNVELRRSRKDGSTVDVTFWGVERRNADGRVIGSLGFMIDSTERKRLEEQFRQAQKMEAVGRLAGGVAHDFNNLLTVINGSSALLLDQVHAEDPLRMLAEETLKAGQRAAELTRQLLAFSRQQVLQLQGIDLNGSLRGITSLLQRLIGEDIELTVELAPGLWPVRADKGQIDQVMMNLAVNARDAMPDGGRLTIATANFVLTPDMPVPHLVFVPGEYVRVMVRDTGHGMNEEVLAHLFEPFFTTKQEGKGTGLGLAMVYGVVKQSRGFVFVDSAPDEGSTFNLYFPRMAEVEATAAAVAASRRTAGSERVLVVEDQGAVRRLVVQTLTSYGYEVFEAEDGEEALRIAAALSEPVQVLVTDIVMPRLTGPVIAERLCAYWPGLRVLFMSGYTERVKPVFLSSPGTLFIQKPFLPADLATKLRHLLDEPF